MSAEGSDAATIPAWGTAILAVAKPLGHLGASDEGRIGQSHAEGLPYVGQVTDVRITVEHHTMGRRKLVDRGFHLLKNFVGRSNFFYR